MLLRFLIGPTAVGKTALAIDWAKANDAEILCADAPLVYRGMGIGTAKPTLAEQRQVKHHGIDLVDVGERFSIADYIAVAKKVVADVAQRGKNILVVGGSGFYLKSFFEPVTDGVGVSEEIAARAVEIFEARGLEGLIEELKKIGGENIEGLDIKNPRRAIKALERCMASSKGFQEIRRDFLNQPMPFTEFKKRMTMLVREKEDLENRIAGRVEQMLDTGLIDEVKKLRAAGLKKNPQAASVIGYRETLQYLDGKLTLPELKALIVQDTLQLARKQRTFFKQLPIDETVLLAPNEKAKVSLLT